MFHPASSTRTLVLWCPDWPVIAAAQSLDLDRDLPIALVDRGLVFACSAAARVEGVKRGLRIREAQARCPELIVEQYDPALDARVFEPALAELERLTPGVQLLRPGTCAIRSRGPSRYYGGELAAALTLLGRLGELGFDARAGIADGPFTAEQAARAAQPATRVLIVPEGGAAEFLAPLPIGILDRPDLVALLKRLGIRTLGEFAALEAIDVEGRFGVDGARLHAIASGLDARSVSPRTPPAELDGVVWFEPPVDRIDQAAFAFKQAAERFIDQLTAAKLVCTALRIEVDAENGEISERSWLHPRSFTPAEVVDRLRWQLQGNGTADGASGLSAPITRVRVVPESVDAIGNHERGLFGDGPDERVHHALSRVQSMLGHEGVLTVAIGGGRTLAERAMLVPWGDWPAFLRSPDQPWPGSLPQPAPATVFPAPHPVTVFADSGEQVSVDERAGLSAAPARLVAASGASKQVTAWAGPWPIDERWWDAEHSRAAHRFQVVDDDGLAWLLVLDAHGWWAEARYD
ncbi:DNA polymerase Y family protein [Diaminobutyricimonas sp. LJ205]|uniref:DNA polymerase Y family protein n=1 Tax=Diaminobutyricimonas sp. LJ205 TaxID=2683590 RepID=UPI001E2BC2F6|nr:DNA polymerase Y family protein [Diaminobutyricimonas sp. LJ205]